MEHIRIKLNIGQIRILTPNMMWIRDRNFNFDNKKLNNCCAVGTWAKRRSEYFMISWASSMELSPYRTPVVSSDCLRNLRFLWVWLVKKKFPSWRDSVTWKSMSCNVLSYKWCFRPKQWSANELPGTNFLNSALYIQILRTTNWPPFFPQRMPTGVRPENNTGTGI